MIIWTHNCLYNCIWMVKKYSWKVGVCIVHQIRGYYNVCKINKWGAL